LLIACRIGRTHGHCLAKTLLVSPRSERMGAAATAEGDADNEWAGFSLGEVVSSGIGYDKRYLMLCDKLGNRVRASGIYYSGQNVYFFACL